jgi:glycosyltransferase involved in cell wall biosynthesis
MRILFLSSTWPSPPNNGLKMRTWALLRALSANGHSVVFLGVQDPGDIQESHSPLAHFCEQVFAAPGSAAIPSSPGVHLSRARNLLGRNPHSVAAMRSTSAAQFIRESLSTGRIDAIFCEQTQFLINVPDPSPVPLLLDNHNAEHVIWRRFLLHAHGFIARSYARLESARLREWERRSCERATIAMTCSEEDRNILQSLCPRRPFFVVPNVLDTDRYLPSASEEPLKVIYQGGMDWYPNRDAVAYFVEAILPVLRRLAPDAQFVVAGRNPSEAFRHRFVDDRDVRFTGTLADLRPEMASAAVCVVPLRIGSGTRLKILEAAALGKAIVSTRLGAEGLAFRNNEEIVLADDPTDFAREVANLLADPGRRRWLGSNARIRVQELHSFPVLCKALDAAMAAIPGTRPATRTEPRVAMSGASPALFNSLR